mgnify:CR=1 FL=1
MGMGISGGSKAGEQRLAVFFDGLAAKGIDVKDLPARIRNPIRFIPPWGGSVAYGFEALILADICDAVLAARQDDLALAQRHGSAPQRARVLRLPHGDRGIGRATGGSARARARR